MPQRMSLRDYLLFICSAIVLLCPASAAEISKVFASTTYKYSVRYPGDWYLDAAGIPDTLDIDNFPSSAAVHAVHLPPAGAEITLRPLETTRDRQTPPTLESWANSDSAREEVTARSAFEIDSFQGKMSVVEVRGHDAGEPPVFEWDDWYFRVSNRMFHASVVYWQGNPQAERLRKTLQQIVLSLRVKA